MKNIIDEVPDLKKMSTQIKIMKFFNFIGGDLKNEINEQEQNINKIITQIDLFNERFSDKGWILYDRINLELIEEVNRIYDEDGIDKAEDILIKYYSSSEVEEEINLLKFNYKEITSRYDLILKAFKDHKEERYHASIVLLLILIDGIVNDFEKSSGSFNNKIDFSVCNSFTGTSNGLNKIKDTYYEERNEINNETIYLPYRNGILNGKDLKYDNIYVSSKCIALLLAISDWIKGKKSENIRKEKFVEEEKTTSFKTIVTNIKKSKECLNILESWKASNIVIGTTIPSNGSYDEYNGYEYIQKLIKALEYWSNKDYEQLCKILYRMFIDRKSFELKLKACKELFEDKELISYKLIEVEERDISIKRVLIEATWNSNNKIFIEELEFGISYQGENFEILVPNYDVGEWVIVPWKIQGLYKI